MMAPVMTPAWTGTEREREKHNVRLALSRIEDLLYGSIVSNCIAVGEFTGVTILLKILPSIINHCLPRHLLLFLLPNKLAKTVKGAVKNKKRKITTFVWHIRQKLYSQKLWAHKKTTLVSAFMLFCVSISGQLSSLATRSPRFCTPPWNKMSLQARSRSWYCSYAPNRSTRRKRRPASFLVKPSTLQLLPFLLKAAVVGVKRLPQNSYHLLCLFAYSGRRQKCS